MFRGIPSRANPVLPPGGDQFLPHHVEDDLVGHEFAAVEILLNGQAQSGSPRYVIAQQFTGRNAGMSKCAAISAP